MTAAWFDPQGRHAGSSSQRPATAADYSTAISEEQLVDASTMIPMAMIEVETERVRLSLSPPTCCSADSFSSSSIGSTHPSSSSSSSSSSPEEEGEQEALFDFDLAADIEGGTSRDAAVADTLITLSDESLQQVRICR